jgi:DNA-binding NarL/FixJ family response regulator
MGRVRVLLLEVPRLLRDILEQAIQVNGECELVKDLDATATPGDRMPPDVVILGLTAEEDATIVPALFARWPHAEVMTVMQQGDAATLYEVRPKRRVLGEMSPNEIVEMLRDAVQRARGGSIDHAGGNDARTV